MDKCPNCGSENFGKIFPEKGTNYFLSVYDSENGQVTPSTGVPVDPVVCADCSLMVLTSPIAHKLKKND